MILRYTRSLIGGSWLVLSLLVSSFVMGQPVRKPAPTTSNRSVVPPPAFDFDIDQDLSDQLLSYEELYQLALTYSPLLKFETESATAMNAMYRLSRIQILQNLNGFANASTGNQGIVSFSPLGVDNTGQIANGYRAGVNVQMSLYDLFGRNQLIRQARANYNAALLRRDVTAQALQRDLITIYQDLLTSQRVYRIRLDDVAISYTSLQMAEVESKQGRLLADNYASASSRYAQAKTQAEADRGQLLKNLNYLAILVGVPMQKLKRK